MGALIFDTFNVFSLFQVYTGPYRPPSSRILQVSNTKELSEGHLVAVRCENYEKEPTLGKVLKVYSDSVDIVWLEGDYSKAWKIARHRDPKNKRRLVDWTDIVPKSSILLFDFKLTSKNHLRKSSVEHLKKIYSELKEE